MDKIGFTFYPKDWWTSETYFELTPIQRYYYLECLFIMYSNGGYMKTQKTQFENRTRTQINNIDWEIVTSKFLIEENMYTHISVNKRIRKAVANKENGKKGGRPPKPKKPNLETQNNPPLEREREREREIEIENTSSTPPNLQIYSIEHLGISECRNRYDESYQVSKEQICIKSMGLIKITQIEKLQNSFDSFLISQGITHKTLPDYAKHFGNWVSKKSKDEIKTIFNQKVIDPNKPIESDYDRIMRERNKA